MSSTILINDTNFSYTKDKLDKFIKDHPSIHFIHDTNTSTEDLKKNLETNPEWKKINYILGVKNNYKLDAPIFDLLPKLKAVSFCSAGYNQIDHIEATKRKIQVSRVYDLDTSTADTNLFLLLGAMRFYQVGFKDILNHKFRNPNHIGVAPNGKTVGIVGLGAIGKQVAARLKPLGFKKILYYNRSRASPEIEKELGVEYVSTLDELLPQVDILDLNCALTKETYHLINAKAFSLMKDGVIIVNTARGDVIDEPELIKNLKNGKILSAGLDVFANEPNINFELPAMENVIALPHLGSYSKATRLNAQLTMFENLESFLEKGKLVTYIGEQKDLF